MSAAAEPMQLVETEKDLCRVYYTCVRECPVKAIRIIDGQAEVLPERCIGCGNCVRVCGREAKRIRSSADQVRALLGGTAPVTAMVAPSFPAEFQDLTPERLAGCLHALGFAYAHEVAFGADLVAQAYRDELERNGDKPTIATSCPALVSFVETYYPDQVENLSPVVSPMVATARALRQRLGDELRTVFIGPCVAKKHEAVDPHVAGDVDAVLTFAELRQMLEEAGIDPAQTPERPWDEPTGLLGGLFSVARGLLQAADLEEDLAGTTVVTADGHPDFSEAVASFAGGKTRVQLLEILCCNGCIMGAGMTAQEEVFDRRAAVSAHIRDLRDAHQRCPAQLSDFDGLDLTRRYTPRDPGTPHATRAEIDAILEGMGKDDPREHLNCGACGYGSCVEHAEAIATGMAESEMCLPYAIDQLHDSMAMLAESETKFRSLFENAVEGIFQSTPAGRFLSANPAMARILGYETPDQLIAELTDISSQLYANPEDRAPLLAHLERGEVVSNREVAMRRRDGSEIWATLYMRPMYDEEGAFTHIEGMLMDCTEQHRAAEERANYQQHLEEQVAQRTRRLSEANSALEESLGALKAAQGQLVQSEKMASLGGLVAGVAHEINTPVGNAVTATSHLRHLVDQFARCFEENRLAKSTLVEFLDDAREASSMITANLERAAELVQSFKRVAVDQTAGERRNFLLAQSIRDVLLSLRPKLKRRPVEVTVDCPEDLAINSFPGPLAQLLTNLIMNSLLHAYDPEDEGVITISAARTDDGLELVYRDDGKGMPADVAAKVFEPFFTTRRGQGGTGLGLHILYNLVTQRLNGSVDCQSAEGEGTTFTIRIPASEIDSDD